MAAKRARLSCLPPEESDPLLSFSSDEDDTGSEYEEPCLIGTVSDDDDSDDILDQGFTVPRPIRLSRYASGDPDMPTPAQTVQSPPQDANWSEQGNMRQRFPFTGVPGITIDVVNPADELEYFQLFFDETLVKMIVDQTNLYAAQYMEDHGADMKQRSRATKWVDTDSKEMRVYLALLLLQGIVQKPVVTDYFSKRASIETPFFAKTMNRDRFLLLSKFLHFSDNRSNPGDIPKKLYKLWPVLDHMKQKFSTVYIPERDISIDESLMLWKGRLGWRQYIPSKRARNGIKSYELCESSSGYVWDFFVYTGKETAYRPEYVNEAYMGSKCVLSLVHPLLDQGYCVHMDNFFSSPELFHKLCNKFTDAVGTVRANRRDMPDGFANAALQKGGIKKHCFRENLWLFGGETRDMSICSVPSMMLLPQK